MAETLPVADMLPNKLFRFNGDHWMEIPKETTDTYLDNEEYLDYLKTEINAGRIDIDELNEDEREQITKSRDT